MIDESSAIAADGRFIPHLEYSISSEVRMRLEKLISRMFHVCAASEWRLNAVHSINFGPRAD